jgi:hypothetical protein
MPEVEIDPDDEFHAGRKRESSDQTAPTSSS